MAYDEALAEKTRQLMKEIPGFNEKKMFGGVGFMINGNMACGVNENNLIVRVGAENYETSLKEPFVSQFDMIGRAMKGWVVVAEEGVRSRDNLKEWAWKGVSIAQALPKK
jgi:TfoX/Sxy family transcriptional regulator of competence genes